MCTGAAGRQSCYYSQMGGLLILLLLWAAVGGGIGYWIGSGKGRGGVGFALGLAFGWIGWIIVALLHPTVEVEARRMAALAAALRRNEGVEARRMAALPAALRRNESVSGTGRPCPWCAEIIKPAASVCRYCGRTVPPAPAAVIDAPAAALQRSGERSILLCSECGFWPRPGEVICDNCGLELPEATIEVNKDRYPV
jgi:hypothetical protein